MAETYEETVRALSDAIVDAQRPLRVLDAIKWDENVWCQWGDTSGSVLTS